MSTEQRTRTAPTEEASDSEKKAISRSTPHRACHTTSGVNHPVSPPTDVTTSHTTAGGAWTCELRVPPMTVSIDPPYVARVAVARWLTQTCRVRTS